MKNRTRGKSLLALAVLAGLMLTGCGSPAGGGGAGGSAVSSGGTSSSGTAADPDQAAADRVAELIDAIYVQQRTEETDAQCVAAKEAWDALTDAQKQLVEGENAGPDYFGLDTGDASADDPRNGDDIGENEILVVSFGTSFNDSRVQDIKGVEDTLQAAFPDRAARIAEAGRTSPAAQRYIVEEFPDSELTQADLDIILSQLCGASQ